MKPRQIEWVFIAKGLTMIGIVVGYIMYEMPGHVLFPLGLLLFYVHVNVFFVTGGFFTNEEKLLRPVAYISRKYHTLYRKLLLFYIPAVLLHNVLFRVGFYDVATEYGGRSISLYGVWDYVRNVFLAVFSQAGSRYWERCGLFTPFSWVIAVFPSSAGRCVRWSRTMSVMNGPGALSFSWRVCCPCS